MAFLRNLKEKRDRKARFGIKPKVIERVVIPDRLIEDKVKDLAQWCDFCKDVVAHWRITYDGGKRACRCTGCAKITLIATKR